jgi:dTDP-4-dehydrorhamnose 3,5-epimerase-like enzyme
LQLRSKTGNGVTRASHYRDSSEELVAGGALKCAEKLRIDSFVGHVG